MLETPTASFAQESLPAGEALLKLLRLQGIRALFSSPGSEWPALWDALAAPTPPGETPLRFYNTRHESLAVAMAMGYQKATGELPAVILHSTVGPLNGAMPIRMAQREGVPMLLISGDSNSWGMRPDFDPAYQWLRSLAEPGGPARVLAPLVKWSEYVGNVWQFGEMVQQACRVALATPGGVAYLCTPFEIMQDRIPVSALPTAPVPQGCYAPDPRALDRFAEALLGAHQPVIITEEAGRVPENVASLVALAEALGAGVVEAQTASYANFPTGHPLHQGFQSLPVVRDADVVLLLGVRGPWHPPAAQAELHAKVLLADEDQAKVTWPIWPYRIDDYAPGSLGMTIGGLLDRIRAAGVSQDAVEERSARWADRHRQQRQAWRDEAEAVRNRIPLDPRWVCKEIGELLPSDALVAEETTSTRKVIERYFPRTRPGSWVGRMTAGLGVGLSLAVGVKIAHPDRPVISLVGDGAFHYNPALSAFGCMQEYNAPVLTVIFNNKSYVTMKRGHADMFPEGWAARTDTWYGAPIEPTPEYALLAPVFGGFGERVDRPEQIRPAFERALVAVRSGRLAILDVVIST